MRYTYLIRIPQCPRLDVDYYQLIVNGVSYDIPKTLGEMTAESDSAEINISLRYVNSSGIFGLKTLKETLSAGFKSNYGVEELNIAVLNVIEPVTTRPPVRPPVKPPVAKEV
jgi:hypothetical protein